MRWLLGFLTESDTERNAARRTFGDLWCSLMHSSVMWPIHGHYACATCGRQYPVPWANIQRAEPRGHDRDAGKEIRPFAVPQSVSKPKQQCISQPHILPASLESGIARYRGLH